MTESLDDKRDKDGAAHVGGTSPDDEFDTGQTGAEARADED